MSDDRKIRATITAQQYKQLLAIAQRDGVSLSAAFDRLLASGSSADANGNGRRDVVEARTDAIMNAIEQGVLETGDPARAVANAKASEEEAADDVPEPQRARRRSPLARWASDTLEGEEDDEELEEARRRATRGVARGR